MKRSKGTRHGTRHKLRKNPRERGPVPVTRMLQEFEIGQKVHIIIEPSIQKGQPHHRFHGKTGTVTGKRGSSYIVEVFDGRARKQVIARPVHLRSQGG
ncbi:MAG: 50S ribosomal protein L21e [Euryarchaeota archaeon]|nr:50S ribosomal protein L21e [Euryarchaeota archaeon]